MAEIRPGVRTAAGDNGVVTSTIGPLTHNNDAAYGVRAWRRHGRNQTPPVTKKHAGGSTDFYALLFGK